MNEHEKENLYRLFREHDQVLGSSRTALVSLHALIQSIEDLKCPNDQFQELLFETFDLIKHTKPRIIPLIHLIEGFEEHMKTHYEGDIDEIKSYAIKLLKEQIALYKSNLNRMSDRGTDFIDDEDVIILHSTSSVVTESMIKAKKVFGRKFKVIMLKQNFVKTKELVNRLSSARIEHLIIPEFDLCHYVEAANKLFIGALSVSNDKQVVCAPGTSNIVSLCHVSEIPVYLFVNSLKFSEEPLEKHSIPEQIESMCKDNFTYRLMIHSHDLLPLDWVDHIITERGELNGFGF